MFAIMDEVMAIAGAWEIHTIGNDLSDLDDTEFLRKSLQLEVDAAFRSRIDTLLSPLVFSDSEMDGSSEDQTVLNDDEVSYNSSNNFGN